MQKIIQGISHLPQILKEINCPNLFLVIDSSYPFLNIKEDIEALDVRKVSFSDFTPNPVFEDVCKGIDLIKQEGCDAILAVGGGSSIDVAKCIKLAILAEEGNDAIIPPLVSKRLPIDGSKIPFIAIPTTAGTGSESTHNAVMYYEGAKQTVTNDGVLPDYAILEPSVLKTLPLYQKKCTMMDALCQGIESWWSVNSTDESKGYSKTAVELVMKYWKAYIFDNDSEAAAQIMLAANYAGRAINIAQTTAAHAMSYKITSLYKLPHGHAVAVCLPEIWEYMIQNPENCIDSRGWGYVSGIFGEIASAMGCESPEETIKVFRSMMKDMDLKNPVAGDREVELQILSKSVNPVRLKNNPVGIDEKSARELYEIIISGGIKTDLPIEFHEGYRNKLLSVMKDFISFCEENKLKYYAAYGTVLGAVRHNGLIPWDDDIDVYMPREDYERLISLSGQAKVKGYEIVDWRSKDYCFPFGKFIDLNSTIYAIQGNSFIQGVYIDIFPLDFVSGNKQKIYRDTKKYRILLQSYFGARDPFSVSSFIALLKQKKIFYASWYMVSHTIMKPFENILKKRILTYFKNSGELLVSSGGPYKTKEIMEKSWVKDAFYSHFEKFVIPIPGEYDAYLKQLYGEYMTPPPIDKQVSHHDLYYLNLSRRLLKTQIDSLNGHDNIYGGIFCDRSAGKDAFKY